VLKTDHVLSVSDLLALSRECTPIFVADAFERWVTQVPGEGAPMTRGGFVRLRRERGLGRIRKSSTCGTDGRAQLAVPLRVLATLETVPGHVDQQGRVGSMWIDGKRQRGVAEVLATNLLLDYKSICYISVFLFVTYPKILIRNSSLTLTHASNSSGDLASRRTYRLWGC